MRPGQTYPWFMVCLLGLLSLVILPACSKELVDGSDKAVAEDSNRQRANQLPGIFDFEYYKSVYKKDYDSLGEELIRRKIVLAKAFRAFVSGVAYKHRRSAFYLALNPNSDRTPLEIKKSLPKKRPFQHRETILSKSDNSEHKGFVFEPELIDERDIEQQLKRIKQQAAETDDEAYRVIASELEAIDGDSRRNKRSAASLPLRVDFSFDNLIKSVTDSPRQPLDDIPSNNPDYVPPEVTSFGPQTKKDPPMDPEEAEQLLEHIKIAEGAKVADEQSVDDDELDESSSNLFRKLIGSFMPTWLQNPEEGELGDIRYVDHSTSECMIPIGNQGDCGSCYAFAMTAYYSWLLCKQVGVLAHISEQYIIDCGPKTQYKEYVDGCDGGTPEFASGFFEDYGSELASKYPYVGKEGACPYDDIRKRHKMGYIRWGEGSLRPRRILKKKFAKQLVKSPIVIAIGVGGSFWEYGGGVHDGKNCCQGMSDKCDEHSVVLVGHGREDGEDYWIIRNSHSPSYGERGYYRLNKKADCIHPREGYVFTPSRGGDIVAIRVLANLRRSKRVQTKIEDMHRYINYTKPS